MRNLIEGQRLNESYFDRTMSGKIILPKGTRAYLDRSSAEFEYLTFEQKLCNMGAAIVRGIDLYEDFNEDIENHIHEPGYGTYGDSARRSIIKYISFLRECNYFNRYFFDADLKKLINILVEEIQLRYVEKDGMEYDEFYASFCSIPHDHKDIKSRYDIKTEKGKQQLKDYVFTSQETISKAAVSEDYILHINRWKKLFFDLKGDKLYFDKELIYPGDEHLLHQHNESKKKDTEKFILQVPPEPWSANILHSKLVLLSMNPGYVEHLNKTLANMFRKDIAEQIIEDKKKILTMDGNVFDMHEATRILGEYYWKKILMSAGTDIHGDDDKEKIFSEVAVCQYLAYATAESTDVKKILPSQRFTKMVIFHLATSKKDVKFLVMRGANKWKKLLGEGLWNYLIDNDRLLISEHYRTQSLSEKNIGADNYRKIKEHLK